MGEVRVRAELKNYGDILLAERGHLDEGEIRSICVDALVDTGAVVSMLPQDAAEALGLSPVRKTIVTYADDRKEERQVVGALLVEIAGRKMITDCVVGPPGSEPLVGQVVLETLDLVVDCARNQLSARPESPFLPTLKMK